MARTSIRTLRLNAGATVRALESFGNVGTEIDALAAPLGRSPKSVLMTHGTLQLVHFRARTDSVYRVPLLMVSSIINQPTVLDLMPGQSMVEFLLDAGFDVYMVEWGRPRREHASLTLADHVLDKLPACIARVLEHSGERDLSVVGYCLGGLLSVLYASLHEHTALKNLVCIATPVDSDGLASFKAWMGPHFDEEGLLQQYGNVPAEWMQTAMRALRPFGKTAGALQLLNQVGQAEAVRSNLHMGKWEMDNIPMAGGVFRELVRDFLRANRLVQGTWTIGGLHAKPSRINASALHLVAREDHIVPYAASRPLLDLLVGSRDKEEIIIKGGHVGLVTGRGALTRMWPALVHWLAPRSV